MNVNSGVKPSKNSNNGRLYAMGQTLSQRANPRKIGKKAGRKARRTIVGAVGGLALGTVGLAAGLATGDPSKAFQYATAAGAVGASTANSLAQKGIDKAHGIKEQYKENKLGTDEYNTQNSIKELSQNNEFRKLTSGKTKKEKEQIIRDFHANGITGKKDIIKAISVQDRMVTAGKHVTQDEVMAAFKIRKRFGDKYKDVQTGLSGLGVPNAEINKAMEIIENLG